MRKLIESLETLEGEIERIIGTPNSCAINSLVRCQWSMTNDGKYINFDKYEVGDMWEFTQYRVSSLAMKQEELFKGEKDGLHFIMAYPNDCNWDDAELLIFDEIFRQEWNPSDDW